MGMAYFVVVIFPWIGIIEHDMHRVSFLRLINCVLVLTVFFTITFSLAGLSLTISVAPLAGPRLVDMWNPSKY